MPATKRSVNGGGKLYQTKRRTWSNHKFLTCLKIYNLAYPRHFKPSRDTYFDGWIMDINLYVCLSLFVLTINLMSEYGINIFVSSPTSKDYSVDQSWVITLNEMRVRIKEKKCLKYALKSDALHLMPILIEKY